MIYIEVFKKLNRRKVKYAVVGGVAVVLHGYVRNTLDLDLIIDPSPKNVDNLFSSLHDLGYLPRVPVTAEEFKQKGKRKEWLEQKNMKAFSFFHLRDPLKIIDILISEINQYEKFKKVFFKAGGVTIPVISISDLKRLKLKANRLRDRDDIYHLNYLEKIKKNK